MPIASDDSDYAAHASKAHYKSRSHRASLSEDFFGTHWSPPCPSHHRVAAQRSGLSHVTFPDEEDEDAVQSTRHSRAQEKRRPSRLPPAYHAQSPSIAPPMASTGIRKLVDLQLRISPSDLYPSAEDFSQKQLEEQIKEVYSALRRVEDEREKVLSQMKAGRADQCRVERELEKTRRENQRLEARLEEMLRSSKMKSPLSARSDDGWGCSMYDMEVEGR